LITTTCFPHYTLLTTTRAVRNLSISSQNLIAFLRRLTSKLVWLIINSCRIA